MTPKASSLGPAQQEGAGKGWEAEGPQLGLLLSLGQVGRGKEKGGEGVPGSQSRRAIYCHVFKFVQNI